MDGVTQCTSVCVCGWIKDDDVLCPAVQQNTLSAGVLHACAACPTLAAVALQKVVAGAMLAPPFTDSQRWCIAGVASLASLQGPLAILEGAPQTSLHRAQQRDWLFALSAGFGWGSTRT